MIIKFDEYELDPDQLELRRAGRPVRADTLVLRLLAALVRKAGQLVTKAELIARVWDDRAVSDNVLTVAMVRLRKALGQSAGEREFIVNVHGRGYRFVRPITEHEGPLAPVLLDERAPPERIEATTSIRAPFVGREVPLRRLQVALDEARAGRGSVCLLLGEPGIGKTRTVEQLAQQALTSGVQVAWGVSLEAGETPPLSPFVQLVRELDALPHEPATSVQARGSAHERRADRRGRGDVPAGLSSAQHAIKAELRGLWDADSLSAKPANKHRLFAALLEVFAPSGGSPTRLLVLDDLHRADAASLEFLCRFVDRIARTNVLLVCTLRPVASSSGSSADLAYVKGHCNCQRIELERLGEEPVTSYVAALLDDPDGRLARGVFAKSEGNPFFMVELARQLVDAERPDPDTLTVPDAALDLLRPRLLELDRATGGVLSCASVLGRSFDLGALAAVSGSELGALMVQLDEAIASGVVHAAPDSRVAFTFGHELQQRVLYEALPPALRRRHHLAAAAAFAESGATSVGTVSSSRRSHAEPRASTVRAYHLHAALPDGDPGEAVASCAKAADDAGSVFAFADGVRYLRHALEALALQAGASPLVRLTLLLRQAIYARISAHPEFESITRAMAELARAQRAGPFLVHAGMLLDLHAGFPPLDGAREVLEEALALLPPSDHEHRGVILARLSTLGPIAYDAARCQPQVAHAVELGKQTMSVLTRFAALTANLYLSGGPEDPRGSAEACAAFAQLCRDNPDLMRVPPVLLELHRAITALQRGELGSATSALERAEARCHELGSRELLWHVARYRALLQIDRAGRAEGAAALHVLHRQARADKLVATELLCLYDEVVVLGSVVTSSALRAACVDSESDPPNVWSLKVRALAAGGLHEEARELLGRVPVDALAALPCDRDFLGTIGALTRAALALDARDYVHALYPLLARYPEHFAAHVSFFCEGSTLQLCGEIATHLGRHDDAQRLLSDGAARAERAGLLASAADARRAWGR
jgi:DNA-binding winged helix-turn-helix (wHTH) protein